VQNLPDIKLQLSRTNLFDAFKKQLAKDFQQSNFSNEFAETLEPEYDSIHSTIVQELQHSENKADLNIMNLLYRIDISEAQLKRYLSEHSNEDHFNVIAELIIKRVLKKIVIKQYYKNQTDEK
jgi:hypothetical protein